MTVTPPESSVDQSRPTRPVSILLVDDHRAFLSPLALMLAMEPDFQIAAQANSLAQARTVLSSGTAIDVALIDIDLVDGSGLDVIAELRRLHRQARAIVLSGGLTPRVRAMAVRAGASALLEKASPIEEVIVAIRRLSEGQDVLAPDEIISLLREACRLIEEEQQARSDLARLTAREREVLAAIALGLDNNAIGERLHIRPETVRSHVVNLLGKLGVESRLQAVLLAHRHGALQLG